MRRLAQRSAHQFSRRSIERATLYVEHGLVELREGADGGETNIFAVVRGSRARPYVIGIDLSELDERATIASGCTCPYAGDGAVCKHVFAVLLALDRRGLEPGEAASELMSAKGPSLTVDPVVLVPVDHTELDRRDVRWFGPKEPLKEPVPVSDPPRRSAVAALAASRVGRPDGAPGRAARTSSSTDAAGVTVLAPKPPARLGRSSPRRDIPEWQVRLFSVRRAAIALPGPKSSPLPTEEVPRRILFSIDVDLGLERGGLVIGLFEEREGQGGRRRLRPLALELDELERLPERADRDVLKLMAVSPVDGGARAQAGVARRRTMHESLVHPSLYGLIVPALAATARLECQGVRVAWDDGEPWRFGLVLRRVAPTDEGAGDWAIAGHLYRGTERIPLEAPLLLLADGLVLMPGSIARLDAKRDFPWIVLLRSTPLIRFPERAIDDVLAELSTMFELPRVELESGGTPVTWRVVHERPVPRLVVSTPAPRARHVDARLSFRYGGHEIRWGTPASALVDPLGQHFVLRDRDGERAHLERLAALGVRKRAGADADLLDVETEHLGSILDALEAAGWQITGPA